MIIWIIFFAVIIIISYILALRSMRSYYEIPIHSQTMYSQYLIKNEANVTENLLERMNNIVEQRRLIISFERLCRGSKKALVVYGPVVILKKFTEELNLVELEDYSKIKRNSQPILSWEISSKNFRKINSDAVGFTGAANMLNENEEIWWQLLLQPKCEKYGLEALFKSLIRVVVISSSEQKNKDIKQALDKIIKDSSLLPLPQAYASEQIFEFYQQRSLPQTKLDKEEGHFLIQSSDVKYLLS